jgi:hypothetical protein
LSAGSWPSVLARRLSCHAAAPEAALRYRQVQAPAQVLYVGGMGEGGRRSSAGWMGRCEDGKREAFSLLYYSPGEHAPGLHLRCIALQRWEEEKRRFLCGCVLRWPATVVVVGCTVAVCTCCSGTGSARQRYNRTTAEVAVPCHHRTHVRACVKVDYFHP